MSFLNASIQYAIGGFGFYIKPRTTVRRIFERDDDWYTIAAIAVTFCVAQQGVGYLYILGQWGGAVPHFPIVYQMITTMTVAIVASAVIFLFARSMPEGAELKDIYRAVILKTPIVIAFSLSILGLKYLAIGLLSLFPRDTGMALGWYLFAAVVVIFGPAVRFLQALRGYGIWSWSAVAVAIQLFLVAKRALQTNVLMAVVATLAAALASSAAAALISLAYYHGVFWKMTLGALFS